MRRALILLAAALLFVGVGTIASAQTMNSPHANPPAGMKLYAFSSGALTIGKGVLQNFGPMEPPIKIPVGFFVIHHPKGNVLFDTGNNDKIIKDPSYWGPLFDALKPVNTPDIAIDAQLKKIGMTPDDIKYVVVSHMHLDHAGNIAKFPHSTIVLQRDELLYAMWPDEPFTGPFIPGDAEVLRADTASGKPNRFDMLLLDGDLDIFRDGSIVVKRWPGHTKATEMLLLHLPKTGTVLLTADNVYFRENVEKHLPPNLVLAYDPAGIMKAYDYIRYLAASEGAEFFTSHDPDAFKAMKHAPDYYQ